MNPRAMLTSLALLGIISSDVACATFAHGPMENVSVTSTPPGAAIYVNGRPTTQTTPATIAVSRRGSQTLRLERSGYETQEVQLSRRGSHWLWLDFGICSNPLAGQGLDSGSQWFGAILTCAATLAGIDWISGGAFAVQKRLDVELRPRLAPVSATERDASVDAGSRSVR